MKDYRFGSQDASKPSYYVFIKASRNIDEHAFFRYDTPQEAIALFEYQTVMHPSRSLSLGVHMDGTRRADIVERIDGVTVLSDDYKRISPWKDDPFVATAAEEASNQLHAEWRVDRDLAGVPIFVPNEKELASYVPWYLEGKMLRPEDPSNMRTSILEVNVKDVGWVSIDDVRALAKGRGYFNPHKLMVSEYLVSYQTERNGFGGSISITPAEYAFMEKNALQKTMTNLDCESLETLKQEAKGRVHKSQLEAELVAASSEQLHVNPSRSEVLR